MPVSNLFNSNVNRGNPPVQQGYNLGQQGWDPASANRDWLDNFQPDQAGWQGAAIDHGGQDYSYNPRTGEGGWMNRAGLSYENIPQAGGGGGSIWRIDPVTGDRVINMAALQGMTGDGGGDYQNYQMSQYGRDDIAPGEGWGGHEYANREVDPSAAIAAQEYGLQENMQADFAKAGQRAGDSGFNMSTAYTGRLGEAARKASQDRNAIAMQYQYDASSRAADREQEQQMQAAQHDFGGWETGYQGGMQADMFNASNAMDRWSLENQIGLSNNQGMNQWNQNQDYQNQNNMNMMLQNLMMGFGG